MRRFTICYLLVAILSSCWLEGDIEAFIAKGLEGNEPKKEQKTETSFTVTFDKNGGDTEANPQTKTVIYPATNVVTLPTSPVRTGYTFSGWNTAANGSGNV